MERGSSLVTRGDGVSEISGSGSGRESETEEKLVMLVERGSSVITGGDGVSAIPGSGSGRESETEE